MQKEVYRIYLDEPGSPAFLVYDKKIAEEMLDKLLIKFGKDFSVALKKVEVSQ